MDALPHSYGPILPASVSPQLGSLVSDHESNVDFSFLDMDQFDDSMEYARVVDLPNISLNSLLGLLPVTSPSNISCVVSTTDTTSTSTPSHSDLPTTTVVVPAITPSNSQSPAMPVPQQTLDKSRRKNSKIHECTECGYKTTNQKNLGNHMRDAHDIQAFQCQYCPVKVARYDNLESHRKSCAGQPPTNRLITIRTNGAVKSKRRRRVSTRDLPVPSRSLTRPTSLSGPDEADSSTASLPQNEAPDIQSPPTTSRPPREDKNVGPTSNGSYTKKIADLRLEVECLKAEIEWRKKRYQLLEERVQNLERGIAGT